MPKVTIKSKEDMDTLVHLGWSKESSHVQIAVLNENEDTGLWFTNEKDELERLDGSNGWVAQLDRYGINRLIQALRKARDDAYGKDQ